MPYKPNRIRMKSAFILPLLRLSVMVIAGLSAITAGSQVRRVAVGHGGMEPMPSGSGYMEVYEYDVVDFQPQFPGGEYALIRYINSERRYPQEAYARGIEGRVLCSFVVNADGSISHVTVIRGVEESLDKEAVRVIGNMPRWEAGRVGQHHVPVYCVLPIAFRL